MEAPWNHIWPDWVWEKKLGHGSHGSVVRAGRSDGKKAAVKIIRIPWGEAETDSLRSEGMSDSEIRRYYAEKAEETLTEVRFAQELQDHPNIVRIEAYAREPAQDGIGETIFIRMELLTPLTVYLSERSLTEKDVRQLGCDICSALSACHGHKLLHRDVKPENIFVSDDGRFKLGDFGIARRLEKQEGSLTMVGTPLYEAPEIARNQAYDHRADIYSLGLVLYRLLNRNRLPFLNENRFASPADRRRALEWRLKGEALPPPADASASLAQAVLKACAFLPQDRFQTAEQFRQALMNKSAPAARRKRHIALAAAAAAAALFLFFALKDRQPQQTAVSPEAFPSETAAGAETSAQTRHTEASSETESRETAPHETVSSAVSAETTPALPSFPADYTDIHAELMSFTLSENGGSYIINGLTETVFTGDFRLPDYFGSLPVRALGANALEGLSVYEGDLILSHSIRELGVYSVSDCVIEGSVIVPENVSVIRTKAFCRSFFDRVEIREGCRTVEPRAFQEMSAGYLVIPSTVETMNNALNMSSRIGVLEICSQQVLECWLNGEEDFFSTVEEIRLGPEIRDFYVSQGCLIHRPTRTLVRACRFFEIPADGSVEHIGQNAIVISARDDSSYQHLLTIPEGVRTLAPDAVMVTEDRLTLNWATPAFVFLPKSLETIYPLSFTSCCVAAYPGTKAEWIALAEKENGEFPISFSAMGSFWVYCSDGKLQAQQEEGTSRWVPLYE